MGCYKKRCDWVGDKLYDAGVPAEEVRRIVSEYRIALGHEYWRQRRELGVTLPPDHEIDGSGGEPQNGNQRDGQPDGAA
jgi:hypothetical protein